MKKLQLVTCEGVIIQAGYILKGIAKGMSGNEYIVLDSNTLEWHIAPEHRQQESLRF
jgi:hypothetical protein